MLMCRTGRRRLAGHGGEGFGGFRLRFVGTPGDFVRGRKAHQHFRRDVAALGELDETFLAFLEGLVGVAFLADAALGLLAPFAQQLAPLAVVLTNNLC